METTIIGLDLAKSVFQVHGVDDAGRATVRKKLRRAEVLKFFEALPPCLVGMCLRHGTSLGPGDLGPGPRSAADASFLREGLSAAAEE